jgi:uncharacterized membrane protein
MWFIGGVIGAALGAAVDGGSGFFFGAVLGGLVGWAINPSRMSRIEALEKRVAALEAVPTPGKPVEPAPEPLVEPPAPVLREPQPEPEPVPVVVPESPRELPSAPTLWDKLLGINIVAKVGILVLFCGIAFLLKYTYERIHVPVEMRLTGIAVGGLVLLVIGWRLRLTRPGYALILQGGGVGVLYLVIFAAFRMFSLLPGPLTFALLVGVAVFSAALSVLQNSLALAVVGVSGGFLAPLLASTGQGSHVMLFSYYAVLNAGILAIAWVKAWRVLNVVGFGFTFAIGWFWGHNAYRAEFFATTEPFLLLFFLMYIAIPLLFARRRAVELKDYVDGALVFGVPVVAFGLQTALVRDIEYGAAYSALGLALFYLVLASALFRRTGVNLRMLVESYVALSLAFGTLAIPLAFEGRLTSAAWALEGAAVIWIATRQGRLLARVFGYALQFAAGLAFLSDAAQGTGTTAIMNSAYLGSAFIATAGLFCAAYMERNRERLHANEGRLAYVLLAWGALWWFAGGINEITRFVAWAYRSQAVLIFLAASSIAFSVLSAGLRWPSARWLCLVLYPGVVMQVGLELLRNTHPFAHIGAAAWAGAFLAHFFLLGRHGGEHRPLAEGLHAAGVWVLALLGAREVGWLIDTAVAGKRVWPSIAWALVPAALLGALASPKVQARWPVSAHLRSYVLVGGAPLAVFLGLWFLYANLTNNGDPYPLPFVPLLNPLDIAIAAVFLLLAIWLRVAAQHGLGEWLRTARPALSGLAAIAGFIWVNGVLLRTLHHWAGVPFDLQAMFSSRLVQASFSILWMLLALGAMVIATRRAIRVAWIAGAALMAIVVAKLFLVDLSGVGTVERIVSFIGVGLLMLLIGYLSPVPPRREVLA